MWQAIKSKWNRGCLRNRFRQEKIQNSGKLKESCSVKRTWVALGSFLIKEWRVGKITETRKVGSGIFNPKYAFVDIIQKCPEKSRNLKVSSLFTEKRLQLKLLLNDPEYLECSLVKAFDESIKLYGLIHQKSLKESEMLPGMHYPF